MEDETETGVDVETNVPQIHKEARLTTGNNHFDTTHQSKNTDVTYERLLVHLERALSFAAVIDISLASILDTARVDAFILNRRIQSDLPIFDKSGSYLNLARDLASALAFALDPDRVRLQDFRFNLRPSFNRHYDRHQRVVHNLALDLRRDLAIDKVRALDRAHALNRAIIRNIERTSGTNGKNGTNDTNGYVSFLILQGTIILIRLSINEDEKQGSAAEKTDEKQGSVAEKTNE
jgi:hypothetical protein